MTRRRLGLCVITAYVTALMVVAFWPTPVDRPIGGALASTLLQLHSWGVPGWVDYGFVEFTANIAMFAPFPVVVDALRRTRWRTLVILGVITSAMIELTQLVLSADRVASLSDVLANSLGTLIGIGLLLVIGPARQRPMSLDPTTQADMSRSRS